ncbi:MAG: low specificity L-threonine aldolase, partial [Hyphomicrobiaceae bacterium]
NNGGGTIWPKKQIEEVVAVARRHGLIVHMDGARILNAAVAAAEKAKAFAGPCDSAWLDLSKGLGCPVGAVLAGSKTFIEAAWQWKQRMGGALRQSGVLAAAGLYALDHHVERLAEDHANARTLGERVGNVAGIRLDPPQIDTNIVFFDTSGTGLQAAGFCERLLSKGVRMGAMGPSRIRAVTHHDVSADGIAEAGKAVAEIAGEARAGKHKGSSR